MATGSFSDYARHIGASPAYVSKLKKQGRLVMREVDGKQAIHADTGKPFAEVANDDEKQKTAAA